MGVTETRKAERNRDPGVAWEEKGGRRVKKLANGWKEIGGKGCRGKERNLRQRERELAKTGVFISFTGDCFNLTSFF